MDNRSGESASDFLGRADEQEIAQVLWELGEEQKSRQIARLIVQRRVNRPILRTLDLASLISNARLWKERSKKHPATKTFQALRIYVNDELGELRTLIGDAFDALSVGGVLAIISFHSLEDRIIKGRFNDLTGKTQRALIPRDLPLTGAEIDLMVERRGVIIGKFPTEPTDDEIAKNPRARSAKLRAIKKT